MERSNILEFGADVSIATGKPVAPAVVHRAKQDRTRKKYREAMTRANVIIADLARDSELLKKLFDQIQTRMVRLALVDEYCKVRLEMIEDLRVAVDVLPLLAQKEMMKFMGPKFFSIVHGSKAAPERDTGQ